MTKVDEAFAILDNISTDEAILMCSLGKDSLVCLDLMAQKFKKVHCVFMYFVKGLEHVERYIRWAENRYSNIEFTQVPHWNLTYLLRSGVYCVPNPHVKLLKLADVCKAMRLKFGLPDVVLGMKKADGLNRRCMLNTYTEKNYINNGLVYPLANWTQKDILAYMKQHRLPEPVRYSLKASNGLGFNIECFLWMRSNAPTDLQKIYTAFPLSQRILFEYDHQNKDTE